VAARPSPCGAVIPHISAGAARGTFARRIASLPSAPDRRSREGADGDMRWSSQRISRASDVGWMSAAVEVCRQRKEPAGSYPVPLLDSPSQVGLHLAGHSFGAWLVTAAAAKRDQL
jgi:hypothetical protein